MAMWARESERPDWDGLVVDVIEDDEPVGMAYEDAGEVLVEFFPDEDGEPRLLAVPEVQMVLDTVTAMFAEDAPDGTEDDATPAGVDPIDQLASEFDAAAAARGPDDEGFYPLPVARQVVARCDTLDLAVASLEAFRVVAGQVEPMRNLQVDVADAHRGEAWGLFRSGCNIQAAAVLERWAREGTILVAMEVEDAGEDVFVL